MSSLKLSVRKYIEKEQLIEPGCAVLCALSGGADSVCLLLLLSELASEIPFELRAVHVHHGLRESAERDLAYCRALCEELKIPLAVRRVDVRAVSAAESAGIEETARRLRYEAFEEVCRSWEEEENLEAGSVRIAAAHHLEDQAETVLFRLCRGSSVRGLACMRSSTGRIIRPLLSVSRQEIEQELEERKITWCEDETNGDTDFARNALRLQVFPVLKEKVNAASAEHLAAFAGEAAMLEDYLEEETERALGRCLDGPGRVRLKELDCLAQILRRRVLYRCLSAAAGREKDLEEVHVQALEELTAKKGTGSLSMPGSVLVRKQYGILSFEKAHDPEKQGEWRYPDSEGDYRIRVFAFPGAMEEIPRGLCTKWFDYDKIGTLPVFRTRRPGDRIALENGANKTLARWMLDAKIPVQQRDRMVLPFSGRDVLWIPGGRISASFRVEQDTQQILELTYAPKGQGITEGGTELS